MPKSFLAVALFLVPFVLSACVPSVGNKQKAPVAGEFVEAGIVKGFPSNLPLYEKSQIIESYGSREAFGASFIADAGLADVINFYNTALPQLGWQSTLSQKTKTNYIFSIKNDTYSGSVIVNTAGDGKKTAITMEVAVR
jgi:hypothetical protein